MAGVWLFLVVNLELLYLRGSLKTQRPQRKEHSHSGDQIASSAMGSAALWHKNVFENYTVHPTALWISGDSECIDPTSLCTLFCARLSAVLGAALSQPGCACRIICWSLWRHQMKTESRKLFVSAVPQSFVSISVRTLCVVNRLWVIGIFESSSAVRAPFEKNYRTITTSEPAENTDGICMCLTTNGFALQEGVLLLTKETFSDTKPF